MKMEVIELSKFESRKAPFGGSQPFAIAFCYPKTGPVLIKGMSEEVYNYVEKKISPCHYRMVYFGFESNRGFWRFNVKGMYLNLHKQKNGHQRYELTMYKNNKVIRKVIRKVPLKYIKEIDELDNSEYKKDNIASHIVNSWPSWKREVYNNI